MKSSKITLPQLEILSKRMRESAPLIQVILGPRQVGKTSTVEQFCKEFKKQKSYLVSAEGIENSDWIDEQWQRIRQTKEILIIDEIQKIPEWSSRVKKLWDEDQRQERHSKCILLGSSSLTLNKGLTESLTGRFELIKMYHWDYLITNKLHPMDLDDFIKFGGYPGSYSFLSDEKRWVDFLRNSIVETVIGKDILLQARVKSPALFRQCFYLIMNYPAQVISYNKLLGQLQDKGNIDLIKYYIELLESAFLIKAVFKYGKSELRKLSSSPKLVPLAPALSCFSLLENLNSEYLGHVFESMVGAALLRNNFEIFYWAEGQAEVDFVCEFQRHLVGIEVKSGRRRLASSTSKFLKAHPKAKIVYITKENFLSFAKDPRDFFTKVL